MTFSEEKEKFINRVIEFVEDAVRSKKEIVLLNTEDEDFHENVFDMPGITDTDKHGYFHEPYQIIKLAQDEEKSYGLKVIGYGTGEGNHGKEKEFQLGELDSDALCLLADLINKKYNQ
jgi:hypothetical protein